MPLALLLNWRIWLAVILAGALAFGWWEKARADRLEAEIAACQAEKAVFGMEIEEQNQAVKDMEAKAAAAARKGAQALKQAEALAVQAQPEIARLQADIAHPKGKTCGDAFAEIRRQ